MRRFAIPLWVRLMVIMSALAVLPVMIVGYSAIDIATRRAEQESDKQLPTEAELRADLIGRWVHDQAPLVLAFPQAVRVRALSPSGVEAFPKAVLSLIPSATAAVLVDADGVLVAPPARLRPDVDVDALLAHLPLTAAQEEPGVVHMGDPWISTPGQPPSFVLAVQAAPGDDTSEPWILGVQVALDLADELGNTPDSARAVALFDGSGQPLLGAEHALVEPERLRPLLGTRSTFRLEGPNGAVRGAVVPVPTTPSWSLVVVEPADVGSATEIRDRMAWQLAGAVASALLLALIVASSLSRPVEQLRDAVLRVAEGRLDVRAEIQRSDEIGELASAFDHMAVRLAENRGEIAAQQAEIEAFNRELQQRVDERTRELREAQESLVRSGQLAAVAELGAGLAHELNNPLAAVLGLAQVLRVRHPDDPLLVDLEGQAGRVREVVETMRRMQSLEVDPIDAPVVQLVEVLHQVLGLVGGPFRQRGVQLELEPVSPDLRVRINPVQGSRILAQMLNALRAGLEPGATVLLGAEPVADVDIHEVMVRLRPNRALGTHPDRRDDWMASGHGLWVARQLLDRLGGRLEQVVGPQGHSEWRVMLPGVAHH